MTWRAGDLAYVLPSMRLVRLLTDPDRGGIVWTMHLRDGRTWAHWKVRGKEYPLSTGNLMRPSEDDLIALLLEKLE